MSSSTTMSTRTERQPTGRCSNCRREDEAHTDEGKCLYGPASYAQEMMDVAMTVGCWKWQDPPKQGVPAIKQFADKKARRHW